MLLSDPALLSRSSAKILRVVKGMPAEIQTLISMQRHSNGPSWLHPVLCQPAGEHLTQGFQTGSLVIKDCLRLGTVIFTKSKGILPAQRPQGQVSEVLINSTTWEHLPCVSPKPGYSACSGHLKPFTQTTFLGETQAIPAAAWKFVILPTGHPFFLYCSQ